MGPPGRWGRESETESLRFHAGRVNKSETRKSKLGILAALSRPLFGGGQRRVARSNFQVSDLIKLARITVVEIFPLTNGGFIFLARITARPLTDLPSPDESVTQKVWRAIRSVD